MTNPECLFLCCLPFTISEGFIISLFAIKSPYRDEARSNPKTRKELCFRYTKYAILTSFILCLIFSCLWVNIAWHLLDGDWAYLGIAGNRSDIDLPPEDEINFESWLRMIIPLPIDDPCYLGNQSTCRWAEPFEWNTERYFYLLLFFSVPALTSTGLVWLYTRPERDSTSSLDDTTNGPV